MKIAFLIKNRPDAMAQIPQGLNHVVAWAEDDENWSDAQLVKLADVDAFVVGAEPVNEQVLAAAPKLKIVQRLGVGYNTLDLAATKARGIPCCNVAGVNKESVAELCLGLMLALAKNLKPANAFTREANWSQARLLTKRSFELNGKTLGVMGLGAIGSTLAMRARAFNMRIVYHDVRPIDAGILADTQATFVEKEALFAQADVVSVHTPLDDSTRNLVHAALLAKMKPSALFIMAARGGIVDEQALADALNAERIAGAGVDVFSREPLEQNNPLRGAKNILLTPHVAGPTPEASVRTWEWGVENVRRVVEQGQKPSWVVNGVG